MKSINRIQYAIENVTDKSVFIVERSEWEKIVNEEGEPVIFSSVPLSISGLASMASHVMTAGSGIYNPNPGIDVIRYDPADKPYIYNIDHYTVLEHFDSSTFYKEALKIAGVKETEELSKYIQSHVFVVGPYKDDNHWVVEIPEQIREAKYKE